MFLETVSLNLSDHLLIVFLTVIILKQLNLSQGCGSFYVTYGNTNSSIVFKIY